MSLLKQGFPFDIGETIPGTDGDITVNDALLGREAWITFEDIVAAGVELFSEIVRRPTLVRIMKNTTGGAINAGNIVKFATDSGAAALGKASSLSAANDPNCAIVDPTLPSAGVADDDLFLAFVKGPAKVLTPAAGLTISDGDHLAAGASGEAAVAATTAGTSRNVLGTFLTGAKTTGESQSILAEVLLHPATE